MDTIKFRRGFSALLNKGIYQALENWNTYQNIILFIFNNISVFISDLIWRCVDISLQRISSWQKNTEAITWGLERNFKAWMQQCGSENKYLFHNKYMNGEENNMFMMNSTLWRLSEDFFMLEKNNLFWIPKTLQLSKKEVNR